MWLCFDAEVVGRLVACCCFYFSPAVCEKSVLVSADVALGMLRCCMNVAGCVRVDDKSLLSINNILAFGCGGE